MKLTLLNTPCSNTDQIFRPSSCHLQLPVYVIFESTRCVDPFQIAKVAIQTVPGVPIWQVPRLLYEYFKNAESSEATSLAYISLPKLPQIISSLSPSHSHSHPDLTYLTFTTASLPLYHTRVLFTAPPMALQANSSPNAGPMSARRPQYP